MRIAFENHGFASARNATARLQLRNVSGGPPPPSLKYIYIKKMVGDSKSADFLNQRQTST